ncbi:MAG: EamA family transporter [Armatimonadetes bacterium]|nr:EamA family transporter [Armatimonadota bacterium]
MRSLYLVLLSVAMGSTAQVCWKLAATGMGPMSVGQAASGIVRLFTNWLVLLGVALYALASFLWIIVLSRVQLSYAYPMLALTYVVVTLASWFIFREGISAVRLAGIVIIIIGVIMVGSS